MLKVGVPRFTRVPQLLVYNQKTEQKEPGKKPAPSKKPKPRQEVVVQIPLSELHPFPDHPYYNKFGQESRAASPASFPSLA